MTSSTIGIGVRATAVDDSEIVRCGLELSLRRWGASLVDIARAELAIVGPHLGRPPCDVVGDLKRAGVNHVVHLSTSVDRDELVTLLRAGVDALVPFQISTDELHDAVTRVVRGERVIRGVRLDAVRPKLHPTVGESELTHREHEVLTLLATRRTLSEVAAELFVSLATVKTHAGRVYAKLGVNGREQAVRRAVEMRLLN